jgi:hypothetical protein
LHAQIIFSLRCVALLLVSSSCASALPSVSAQRSPLRPVAEKNATLGEKNLTKRRVIFLQRPQMRALNRNRCKTGQKRDDTTLRFSRAGHRVERRGRSAILLLRILYENNFRCLRNFINSTAKNQISNQLEWFSFFMYLVCQKNNFGGDFLIAWEVFSSSINLNCSIAQN